MVATFDSSAPATFVARFGDLGIYSQGGNAWLYNHRRNLDILLPGLPPSWLNQEEMVSWAVRQPSALPVEPLTLGY